MPCLTIDMHMDAVSNIYLTGRSTSSVINLYNGKAPSGTSIQLGTEITMDGSSVGFDTYVVKYLNSGPSATNP